MPPLGPVAAPLPPPVSPPPGSPPPASPPPRPPTPPSPSMVASPAEPEADPTLVRSPSPSPAPTLEPASPPPVLEGPVVGTPPPVPAPSSPTPSSPSPLSLPPPEHGPVEDAGEHVIRAREEDLGGSFIEEPPTGEVNPPDVDESARTDPSVSQMTASELNMGFLGDPPSARPVRKRQIEIISGPSQFATPNPPPHPLAAPSPGVFYTPSSSEYQAYYAYHHAISPDTPAPFVPGDTGQQPSQPEAVAYPHLPGLDISPVTGEVDSDPETPVNRPEPHAVYEIAGPTTAGYMVESEVGDIPVTRIPAERNQPLGTEPQPSTSAQAQPDTDPRDKLRTKVRPTRDRSNSRNQNYPQGKVTKANNARGEKEALGLNENKGKNSYQRYDYRVKGKFAKRTDSESN